MERRKDYERLLKSIGVDETSNRVSVLEIIGNSPSPLTAVDVYETINRTRKVNRVTVYRILELFVEKRLIERISGGDRTYRYGFNAGRKNGHTSHPHFYCTHCGHMQCLSPESIPLDTHPFERSFTGVVKRVEVRIDGLCKNCLKAHPEN